LFRLLEGTNRRLILYKQKKKNEKLFKEKYFFYVNEIES
jgi:hypothetical protein